MSNTSVARTVRWVRSQVRGVPTHTLIWTIIGCSATICLLQLLQGQKVGSPANHHPEKKPDGCSDSYQRSEQQAAEEEEEEEEKDGDESENEELEDEEDDGGGVGERDTLEHEEEEEEEDEK